MLISKLLHALSDYIAMASNDLFIEFLEKTKHLSKHWKELGVMLRLEKHQLDEIESNYPRDVGRCRMDMLSTWLKNNPADPAAELDTALDELQRTVHGEEILLYMHKSYSILVVYCLQEISK